MRKHQMSSGYLIVGVLIIAILIVAYSYVKTGDFVNGITSFIDYIQQDPFAAGILLLSGIILGKLVFRSSGWGGI